MAEESSKEVPSNETRIKIDNKKLMDQFWSLVSLDEGVRIESIKNILEELNNTNNKKEIEYTVQRLVKGLSSGRKAARQGYATALTHVLLCFDQINLAEVFEMMEKFNSVKSSFKGQEERDAYFGQLFGVLCLNQVINKKKFDSFNDISKKIMEKLCYLMKKKSYLREVVANSICDILNHTEFQFFESNYKPLLKSSLMSGWKSCTVEDVMITLKVKSLYQDSLPDTYFSEHWNKSTLLHTKNLEPLSQVLRESTEISHPRVHLIWDVILDHFLAVDISKFQKFWKIIVEDGLMASTHERKFLAISLLLKVSPKLTIEQVPVVFCEPIIRCLINSRYSNENYLFKAVRDVLQKLQVQIMKNPNEEVIPCIIKALVSKGHFLFDSMTQTKTIEELACKIKTNVAVYTLWLQELFVRGTLDDQQQDNVNPKNIVMCRAFVVYQMLLLVRSNKSLEDDVVLSIATFLFLHGHFTIIKKCKHELHLKVVPKHSVDEFTQGMCKHRFTSVLVELNNHYHQQLTSSKDVFGGVAKDGEFFVTKIISYAKKLLDLQKYVVLSKAWLPKTYETFSNSIELINIVNGEKGEKDNAMKAKSTEMLFAHSTLQLFSDHEEAVDTLMDLHSCYKKSQIKKKKNAKAPHWTEVLTEILLGFLAQSSYLMRQVVDAVFPTIVPYITQEAFNILVDAVKSKPNQASDMLEGGKENEKDEENEHDDEEVDDEKKSEEKEDDNEKNGDDVEDSENSDSENDDENIEIDEKLRADVKTALGDFAVNDEVNGYDEEEDIDMDTCDPKLLDCMDQALAAVFRSRKQKEVEKKEKKELKKSVIHFKLRVLDLIEIFIKKQAKDPKVLDLVEPLLELIRVSQSHTDEQYLFERTLGIFKNKLCSLHEYPLHSSLDIKSIHDRIERLVVAAKSASSALFVTYVTYAVVYLIRVLRGNSDIKEPSPIITRSQRKKKGNKEEKIQQTGVVDEERLVKCLNDAMAEFMTKRSSHLQPVLFVEVIQRFPEIGWKFTENLFQFLYKGCNNFRKVKACEMLKMIFSKKVFDMENHLLNIRNDGLEIFTKIFNESQGDSCTLKAKQFQDLLRLADLFIKLLAKHPKVKAQLDLKDLQQSLNVVLESPIAKRSNSLTAYCNVFLKSLKNISSSIESNA
ncbi:myb-binding protein 1A-like protein isoform X1 [Hydra vulgaris]|uniref:myb-binding protein 1A-like protein isoform X1 n=1 Tax=Hydra vulgaris TaxID=6087 RepID=UPI0032EA2EA9